jgi:hypothetical protein
MAGWNQIQQVRKLEERADKLGLKFTAYKHDDMYGESVALVPKDKDVLPIYARDAVMFAGSLEGAAYWMQGVMWAREYDRLAVDRNLDKKRERKEQDERNRILLKTLKDGKPPTLVKT